MWKPGTFAAISITLFVFNMLWMYIAIKRGTKNGRTKH